MKTLIKTGHLYPVTAKPIKNGCAVVEGGRIVSTGKNEDYTDERLQKESIEKVVDLAGYILLPGFVNAHSHLQLSELKGMYSYQGDYVKWIENVARFNIEHPNGPDEEIVTAAIEEMKNSGITAVGDIASTANHASALLKSKIKSVVFIESIGPLEDMAEEESSRAHGEIKKVLSSGRRAGLSPHAPHTISIKLYKLLRGMAKDMEIPVMTHVAETEEETDYIKNGDGAYLEMLKSRSLLPDGFRGTGKRPLELLAGEGLLQGVLTTHLSEIGEDDVVLLKSSGGLPVFCPGSMKWFGRDKVMPLGKMLADGLAPALGTDSLASNDSLSMLDELRAAAEYFPNVAREKFIEMATINGAKALSLNCGSIEPGMDADLIAFRAGQRDDPLDTVFKAEKADIVLLSGRL
jgi:cytosine/adenosine deaminase-related metal-dependent hydrolase